MRNVLLPIALVACALAGAAGEDSSLSGSVVIDRHVQERWKEANLASAPPSDDAEFLRRLSLDVLGTIPSADEAEEFLKQSHPRKRTMKAVELLGRPEYAHNWAELWEDILIGYDTRTRQESKGALYLWLRNKAFANNMPYDQMAAALVASRGVNTEHGPVNFLMRQIQGGSGAINATGKVTRIFLGTQIQCAQCHDHPFDKWTQEDFYGMVSFFTRVQRRKVDSKDQKDQRYELTESPRGSDASYGEGKAKKSVPPLFLDGDKPGEGRDRRVEFARLMTRPENLQFARAVVNRYWGHFFGRGIVNPIDDFSGRNKPSHAALLEELAREFIAQKYDLHWLIRSIVGSKTYQLTSRVPKDRPPEAFFAYAQTRALRPEQLFNALMKATGNQAMLNPTTPSADNRNNRRDQTMALFRRLFGDEETTDMADFDGTISQALTLMNGQILNEGVAGKSNSLAAILQKVPEPERRLELVFLTTLGRLPSARERASYGAYLKEAGAKREPYEDVFWALLNTSEFLFNH
jgi:hypothetical protein